MAHNKYSIVPLKLIKWWLVSYSDLIANIIPGGMPIQKSANQMNARESDGKAAAKSIMMMDELLLHCDIHKPAVSMSRTL